MICNSCMKNVATIKFTEVVDGKAVQHFLCPECYKTQQEATSGFSQSVPRPSVRGAVSEKADGAARTKQTAKCPGCNMTLRQVLESATVGCAGCYDAFGTEIESLLEGLQPGASHRGKTFRCNDELLRTSKDIQSKRVLLRHMIKDENYEEAARLRDEIARLELSVQALHPTEHA